MPILDSDIMPIDVEPENTTIQPCHILLLVRGMEYPTHAMQIRDVLLNIQGVLTVDVTLERGLVAVGYDPTQTAPEALPAAIAALAAEQPYSARIIIVL